MGLYRNRTRMRNCSKLARFLHCFLEELHLIQKRDKPKANLIIEKHQLIRFRSVYLQHTEASLCVVRTDKEKPLWKE